ALGELDRIFPGRELASFPEGALAEAEARVTALTSLFGAPAPWRERLVRERFIIRAKLGKASDSINDVIDAATDAAESLGQPVEAVTLEMAGRIADLSTLAFRAEDRPESDWLVHAGLERAAEALADTRELLESFQEIDRDLSRDYREEAAELPAAEL